MTECMRTWGHILWLALPVAAYGIAVGCSSSSDGGSSGGGGAAGTGGAFNPDAAITIDSGGVSTFDSTSDVVDEVEKCAEQVQKAIRVPVDMYIMMDSSASMADGTPTKWELVTTALSNFLSGVNDTEMGVGIQYFPLRDKQQVTSCPQGIECGTNGICLDQPGGQRLCFDLCENSSTCGSSECVMLTGFDKGCSNTTCSESAYSPAEVEIASLPGAAADIIDSMKSHKPEGATPTVPALKGAVTHAAEWATKHPGRKVVVVFATDGLPTVCPFATDNSPEQQADIEQAKQVAGAALTGSPSVPTFVIGVLTPGTGSETNLNAIAVAGGSSAAFFVDSSKDVVTEFRAAMEKIRGQMQCEFTVPTADAGTLDYMKVNVVYTAGNSEQTTIGYVDTPDKCSDAGGWYYDVPQKDLKVKLPTGISLCPASCSKAQADPNSTMGIQVGCRTIIVGPK